MSEKIIMKIGNGFVSEHLNYAVIPERLELNYKQILNLLDKFRPDVIVNCTGRTGRPNIDWCESNKSDTALTNTALQIMFANACLEKNIHLINVNSGCIFYGPSPDINGWREDDFANPKSYYSKSKYAADLVLGSMDNVSTLRIRMPISTKNNHRNFINKIRNYSNLIDEQNSVTFMDDLVKCIEKIIDKKATGIYHVTNPGTLSAVDVIKEYCKYVRTHKFNVITEEELDKLTLAKRSNCKLNTDKLNSIGIYLKPARFALEDCMSEYIKNI